MTGLLFLLALPYAGDVHRLGDPEYAVRQAAHGRLRQAGVLAAPALVAGDGCPERADRCERLLDGLPRLDAVLVRLLIAAERVPELPEGVWLGLRGAVRRYGEEYLPLPVRGDGGQYFHLSENIGEWMVRLPYYGTTAGGEVRIVLAAVRQKHRGGLTALTGTAAQVGQCGSDSGLTPCTNRR